MFFSKKKSFDVDDPRIHNLNLKILELETQMKLFKQDLERIEVQALESRRVYARKLKNMVKEEKETDESNLKTNVFLGPDGRNL